MLLEKILGIVNVAIRALIIFIAGGHDTDQSINLYLFDNAQSEGVLIPRGDYSQINNNKEIIFIFHGFNAKWEDYREISQLHLEADPNLLVINVDAEELFVGPNYVKAVRNVEIIGNYVANVMVSAGLVGSKVRCMGGSLGAHAAGFTGKRFHEMSGEKIHQIVGNDPAGVLYNFIPDLPDRLRLSKNDASIVITLLTNRGVNGPIHNWGHINFYVNNALSQPGCTFPDLNCSHYYAIVVYTNSILTPKYVGTRMRKWSSIKHEPIDLDPSDTLMFLEDVEIGKEGLYHFTTV